MSKRIATFDIETDALLPDVTKVWCAVVKDHEDGTIRRFRFLSIRDRYRFFDYVDTYEVLIGHNSIGFDFPVLRKLYGWEFKGEKIDTLLMSRLQRPNRKGGHSVANWGHILGHEKVEHTDWTQYSPEMLHRCAEDVEIQYKIHQVLLEEGKGEGWEKAHKINHRLFDLLQKQEEYGWLVDQKHMDRSLFFLNKWIDKIDKAVQPHLPIIVEIEETKTNGIYNHVKRPFKKDGAYSAVTERFLERFLVAPRISGPFSRVDFRYTSLDSNIEVKDFLLKSGWEPDEWNTNNVGEKTSPKLSKDDSFTGVTGSLGRCVVRRVQCKQRRGILEGWKNELRLDGRLPAIVTGLASTGRARHKCVVNVPGPYAFFGKWMRQCFIAKPGWVLVGVDSKGNQVRQLAAQMGDEEFTHAVLNGNSQDGTDIHSINMSRAGLPNRTVAKNFFYGAILFGAGDQKTAKIIDGTVGEARKFKHQYFSEMPHLKQFKDRLTEEWRSTAKKLWNSRYNRWEYRDGYIKGLDDRPIFIEKEHTVLVYKLQSDEAIHMSTAYCIFHKSMGDRGWRLGEDYGTVCWMHDEFQFECRPEICRMAGDVASDSIRIAGNFFNISCPHEGEYKIGKNWYETH